MLSLLKSAFENVLIRHSGKISGGIDLVSDLNLIMKDVLYQQKGHAGEITSGVLLCMYDVFLALSDKNPEMKKLAGACMVVAAPALAWGGMEKPGCGYQMASAFMLAAAGGFIGMEQTIDRYVEKNERTDCTGLKKKFLTLAQYPVLTSAVLQVGMAVPLALSARRNNDRGMLVSAIGFIAAIIVLPFSDEKIRKKIAGENQPEALIPKNE